MRKVKLVESLNVREVRLFDPHELHIARAQGSSSYISGHGVALVDGVSEEIIPVHHLKGVPRMADGLPEAVFIAYTKDVEELLELPFSTLKKENQALKETNAAYLRAIENYAVEVDKFRKPTFIGWLKFLFKGEL